MALIQRTPKCQKYDGRIKVLWIEDLTYNIVPTNLDREAEWLSIVTACHPDDVQKMIQEATNPATNRATSAQDYDFDGLPCDVYLTDFRLCDRKDIDCNVPEHLQIGLHAPSAGFILGLLTALRWPDHPQSIIPYSGWDEEFGQIWRLCKPICPPSVNVLWDETFSKARREWPELLKKIGERLRVTLQEATQANFLQMPFAERDRWESIVQSSAKTVNACEKVWFISEYGLRPFLIGALFYDALSEKSKTVPIGLVKEWLVKVPLNDQVEREARAVAAFYWLLRCSSVSRDTYAWIREFKRGVKKPSSLPPSWQSLLAWKKNTKRGHGGEQAIQVRRLALLFLILKEHASRTKAVFNFSEKAKGVLKFINDLMYKNGLNIEQAVESLRLSAERLALTWDINTILEELLPNLVRYKPVTGMPADELVAQIGGPIEESDVIRLIDPLPGSWNPELSLATNTTMGKAICRLIVKEGDPPFDIQKLLAGDGAPLTSAERLAAERYVGEMLRQRKDWPAWLGGRS